MFEIGSVTKTFTATLLAQAVIDGRLQLDMPVARLLPGFTVPLHGGHVITLGNLATQHSGLPRLPSNLGLADPGDPYADYDGARLKTFLASYPLTRDPGSTYEYSNLGFGLLGYALAQHAGLPYEGLLQKRIFGPLEMASSTTILTAATRAHLAQGHDETGKAVGNWNFKALAGAGAIKSTAADMLGYLKANMGLLKTPLQAAMQLAHQQRADGPRGRIGLAWMTRHDADGDVVWHNGITGGYVSFIGFTADGQRGVVVMTNVQRSVDDIGFATLLKDATLAPAQKNIAMTQKALDAYVGSYRLAPGPVLNVFRDKDQLYSQAAGQGAVPIFASAPDEFFTNVGNISGSFKRDKTGKVDRLILHQNGDHTAMRLSAADARIEAASAKRAITLKPATLASYVGRYRLGANAVLDVTLKDGQLMVQLSGQSSYPVYSSARDKFFYKVVDAQIDFQRDSAGKVGALVLHQSGMAQRAPRIEN